MCLAFNKDRFIGPFPVSKIIKPVTVSLKLLRTTRVHQSFHMSQVKSAKESTLVPSVQTLPPPRLILGALSTRSGSSCLLIAVVIGSNICLTERVTAPEELSRVPSSHIMDRDLIAEFH